MIDASFLLDLAAISRGFKACRTEECIFTPSGEKIRLTEIAASWKRFTMEVYPLLLYRAKEWVNKENDFLNIVQTSAGTKIIDCFDDIVFYHYDFKEKGLIEALVFCLEIKTIKEKIAREILS